MDESELHALVDGELTPQRRRELEDYLSQHKEDAALVENWRRQNAALRAAFEPVAKETPPLSLRNTAARIAAFGAPPIESGAVHWGRPSSSFRPLRRLNEPRDARTRKALIAAAAVLLAAASIGATFMIILPRLPTPRAPSHAQTTTHGYVERAELAYATFAQDTHPVDYDAAHKPEMLAALLERIGFAFAPDLSVAGLRLIGGRLTPGLQRPAGFLIYEAIGGERVALYFEPVEEEPRELVPPRTDQNLTAIEWRGEGIAFVLLGPLAGDRLQAAAERAAYEIATPARDEGSGR